MSSYPHRIRIVRPGDVVGQDPDTGAPIYGEPTVVYEGAADVQDEGEVLERAAGTGEATVVSDARAYLAVPGVIARLENNLPVFIDWGDGTTDDARILRVKRIDDSVHLRWV